MIKRLLPLVLLTLIAPLTSVAQSPRPLRALLITGGCCHDYANQQKAISEGIQSLANVRVDVYWTDNSTTAPVFPLYSKLNWAEDYDVVIHDECGASLDDPALVNRIVQVHRRLPAVHLHCAMHSFRTGGDEWFRHLGLQSSGHGPQQPISISFNQPAHPITSTLEDWTTIPEELYNNVKLHGAQSLASGKQIIPGEKPRVAEAMVAWTNETQGARSFSTTLGHNTQTVQDARYLELITRGLLWACGKLNQEYLVPYSGEQSTVFIDKNLYKSKDALELGAIPDGSTLTKVFATSTQNGHPAYHAIDGDPETRWCANGDSYPQAITLELEDQYLLEKIKIDWEFEDHQYRVKIEASNDSKDWQSLHEGVVQGSSLINLSNATKARMIRITGLQSIDGGWCSIKEIAVNAEGIKKLWPADPENKNEFKPLQADRYETSGNLPPQIKSLTREQELALLKDVTVPDGFEATLFATPPAVNYPVFVASSVDGVLYVSSDGNGSLGRDPSRGRILRLRDLDGDGRADESKVFCEIDAPRGLLWDRDRLFVMHPPNLSVFFDHDGDGVADEQKTLVKNLAFGYDQRPADHTTNGLSIGVDGWLYLAGGDFGFIDAQGRDGTIVTHRGGGVLRVRPDGTQLEIFSTGTRNILEVAISPEMEMFARDNTNDGGGWDVRLHHFTGNEDHGYPRLYKNFNNECVQPLADYGGGSGCGAVYIAEPGFGRWGNAPFTADWGTGALYHHKVTRNGSSFSESAAPQPFIKLTRPTDADVDGNSRIYCASWRGATFKWNGPDVGYIVCVRPTDYSPEPMPNFASLKSDQLVEQFDSPSHRRRLAAQRELFYRGDERYEMLHHRAIQGRPEIRNLLDRLQTNASDTECIEALSSADQVVVHTAVRCLASRKAFTACFEAADRDFAAIDPLHRALSMMHLPAVVTGLIDRLPKAAGVKKRAILNTLCRLHYQEGQWKGNSWGTRPDTRGPYYQPEPWDETERIAETLQTALTQATPSVAANLVRVMRANRIESNNAISQLAHLAIENDELIAPALEQLTSVSSLPKITSQLLQKVAKTDQFGPEVDMNGIRIASRMREQMAWQTLNTLLNRFWENPNKERWGKTINEALNQSRVLDQLFAAQTTEGINEFKTTKESVSPATDILLLTIASRKDASPESRSKAQDLIDLGITKVSRQKSLIQVASWLGNHHLDAAIWNLQSSDEQAVAKLAKKAVDSLKIKPPHQDRSPLLKNLSIENALSGIANTKGDVAIGKAVFEKANCAACHTIAQDVTQRGPYLGNIAKTYKRQDLAVAILLPEKTIAQGFSTNSFLTFDGKVVTGFVTDEQNDRVILRDQNAMEYVLMKDDIEVRKQLTTSMMPSGILKEYTTFQAASLLDYLISISKN